MEISVCVWLATAAPYNLPTLEPQERGFLLLLFLGISTDTTMVGVQLVLHPVLLCLLGHFGLSWTENVGTDSKREDTCCFLATST